MCLSGVEYSTFMTDDSTSCHVMVEILCFPTLGWNFSTIFIYSDKVPVQCKSSLRMRDIT